MAKNYHYRYDTLECPNCGGHLTGVEEIELEIAVGGVNTSLLTRLDKQGNLMDVENAIANGYHSRTLCARCGCDLVENEMG